MAEYRLPPRQKMINLVYIILIAMLAINISADTLDTYSLLNKGLDRHLSELEDFSNRLSSEIVSEAPETAATIDAIDSMTISLLSYINSVKEDIAKAADKKKYTSADGLRAQEELNAVPDVMLSAINPRASRLHESVLAYRDTLMACVSDSNVRGLIYSYLTLDQDKRLTSWEKATFTSMPAIGGMVYLNSLKESILISEIETCRDIAAAVRKREKENDSTSTDTRYVLINNDQKIVDKDGTIEVPVVNASPYIESVLYSEFENPIDILAIGITPDEISYTVEGGTGSLENGRFYIYPSGQSTEVQLHMSCIRKGEILDLGTQTFKIKPLPIPSPHIVLNDEDIYHGNAPIKKSRLLSITSLGASISDPVNIAYTILGFETVLIKTGSKEVLSASSDGPDLTDEQTAILKSAQNGDKLYFTGITVKSPKGSTVYDLPPISAPVYE